MKFQKRIMLYAILTGLIPLFISYIIMGYNQIRTIENHIEQKLFSTAYIIAQDTKVQQLLNEGDYQSFTLQRYADTIIHRVESVDIIVITDMDEIKYSHLDTTQIGDGFVNEDKRRVLDEGVGYYSLFLGSQGLTYRRFEPIFLDDEQVGFVMVGKYQSDIQWLNQQVIMLYFMLFVTALFLIILLANDVSKRIKRKILDMEPEDIAKLYTEKKTIIDTVDSAIILMNTNQEITEMNKKGQKFFKDYPQEELIKRLKRFTVSFEKTKMQTIILDNKHYIVTANGLVIDDVHHGTLLVINERSDFESLAEELTGINEHNKILRATVHEFKNKLHVILGLIKLKAYDDAETFISNLRTDEDKKIHKYKHINDQFVRALLLSKELVASEQKVTIHFDPSSQLNQTHGVIHSEDINAIIGNLMENAFEAFTNQENKTIELSLNEDDAQVKIVLKNNSPLIDASIIDKIFDEGFSSKGETRGYGLAIAKRKVELYQGTLNYKQEDNLNQFIITLRKGD